MTFLARGSRLSRQAAVWAMLAVTGCGQILGFDANYSDLSAVGDGGIVAPGSADSGSAQSGDVTESSDGGSSGDGGTVADSPGASPDDAGGSADTAPTYDDAANQKTADDASSTKEGSTDASAPPDSADLDAASGQPDATIAPAVITHVQNVVQIGSGTSLTATFSNAVKAGDLLIGAFRGAGTVTVSDNVNGSWTGVFDLSDVCVFYLENSGAAAASGLVITVHTTSSDSIRISADDFSGVATSSALAAQSTGSSGAGTTWSAGTTSAIAAGDLVYVGAGTAANNETFSAGSTAGVAMTLGGQTTSASNGTIFSEYVLSSAAGDQNAAATLTPSSGGDGINGGQLVFRP